MACPRPQLEATDLEWTPSPQAGWTRELKPPPMGCNPAGAPLLGAVASSQGQRVLPGEDLLSPLKAKPLEEWGGRSRPLGKVAHSRFPSHCVAAGMWGACLLEGGGGGGRRRGAAEGSGQAQILSRWHRGSTIIPSAGGVSTVT